MSEPGTLKQHLDANLANAFRAGRVCSTHDLPRSAQAYLAWSLWDQLNGPLVVVTDSPQSVDLFYRDTLALAGGRKKHALYYPARESIPGRDALANPDITGDRLRLLMRLQSEQGHDLLVTCVQALMQKTLSPGELARGTIRISLTDERDLDELVEYLAAQGYAFETEVLSKGQASLHGGLLNVWPVSEPWPVRIEFFGPVVDSIRTFDPGDQISVDRLDTVCLPPASDISTEPGGTWKGTDVLDYFPPGTGWLWSDLESIEHHAGVYEETLLEAGAEHLLVPYSSLMDRADTFRGGRLFTGCRAHADGFMPLDIEPADAIPVVEGPSWSPDLLENEREKRVQTLIKQAGENEEVHVFFNSQGACDRFKERHLASRAKAEALHLHVAPLSEGFRCPPAALTVMAESDLYGKRKTLRGRYDLHTRKAGPRRHAGERIADWMEMQPGDFVVHMDHGIGKYLGLYEIEFNNQLQEVLSIEYAGASKLYVPVSQTHLLSRYVGVGKKRPTLHRLGGRRWAREVGAAQEAIRDLAGSLLETQAIRQTLGGHAFKPDTAWQHEFEAAFPFEDTDDQARAVREVKEDLENRRPMDRLICGDVGYGKTEVAIRAAFKAVMEGKQVAVLVPTTVLAQQHYTTFSERMEAFPIGIEMLSRFRTRAHQKEILKQLAAGALDIVIGTHRLLQKDIAFKDLGLVIIDEEQRFGVQHKEYLKNLRQRVDVLTMTATPIPRTLYMGLTGAREMSTIQTPPQERQPIETIVTQYSDEVVREAILRELSRGGQVFYLHNRVMTINKMHERLCKVVPEARIEVAHGQMHERTLEKVMAEFVRGDFDVLLCTTIIESGMDIPNVNTILIDRADRFGMADLYQLRGRVGRYKHKAYAYLLLPGHVRLFDSARSRIRAIQQHTSLGAGFKLALRDLEMRGAGNLLGAQQSGHITAVGFDLYCQYLKRTIAQLKGEKVPPVIDAEIRIDFLDLAPSEGDDLDTAAIPFTYIEDENLRLSIYRKIAEATGEEEVRALDDELRDRFGPVPGPVTHLLLIAQMRIAASLRHIDTVEIRDGKIMLTRHKDYLMRSGRFPRLTAVNTGDRLKEIISEIERWD